MRVTLRPRKIERNPKWEQRAGYKIKITVYVVLELNRFTGIGMLNLLDLLDPVEGVQQHR